MYARSTAYRTLDGKKTKTTNFDLVLIRSDDPVNVVFKTKEDL